MLGLTIKIVYQMFCFINTAHVFSYKVTKNIHLSVSLSLFVGYSGIKCGSSKKCNGLNAFSNLQRLMAVFFAPLLKEGCPTEKQEAVDAILNKVKNGEMDAGSMEILLQGFLK